MKKSPICRRLIPLALFPLIFSAAAYGAGETSVKETWMGLYFNGRKIGYTRIAVVNAPFRGKQALKIVSSSVARIEMLGNKVSQDTLSTTYADSRYRPIHQSYRMTSNGATTTLTAEYRPGKIVCTVASGGGPSTRAIPIPPGANLAVDSSSTTQGQKVEVGQKSTVYYLNPLTISLDRSDVEIVAKEEVTLGKQSQTAYRVSASSPFGKLTTWQTETGDFLKGDMPLGMAMYRETRARALDMSATAPEFVVLGLANGAKSAYTPPSDFALATAVTTDRPIKDPRSLRALSLVVAGIEDSKLALTDDRQQTLPIDGRPNTYRLVVKATTFDAARSVRLPVTESAVQKYLARAPYLETDDPQIQAAAAELRGQETNAYKVAQRIRAWVHKRMKPDYTIGVPRSCTDVYKRARGVCRDYATLFAGVARAAGIPTRVCGGIVYAEGKFFYHAWAECWVGEWVPFDPTQGTDFVDATHIKFAQGDVTDMFNVVGIVGRLKLTVAEGG